MVYVCVFVVIGKCDCMVCVVCISVSSIGIFISGLIIVVNVIFDVSLNVVMVIVMVSLKLLFVVVNVIVVVCG